MESYILQAQVLTHPVSPLDKDELEKVQGQRSNLYVFLQPGEFWDYYDFNSMQWMVYMNLKDWKIDKRIDKTNF